MRLVCLSAVSIALIASSSTARAEAAGMAEMAEMADPIIVTGQREGYDARRSSSATKTDSDLQDVPQAVSVISAQQIDDQAMRSVGDVLRYVPGAIVAQGEGHRDQIVLRGNASTADFFVDGLRDDVQYYRGLYNLERVEVLKGPNAMIFGRGGGGGIVNRVTKRPHATRSAGGALSADNEGAWYAQGDLNAPLGRSASARLNAVYEAFDNFRDSYAGHRVAINPTLAVEPGPDTRIDAGFEYARDRRTIDRGVPSARPGSIADPALPLDGFDESFFGDGEVNRSRFTGKVGHVAVEHRFSDTLKLSSKALYGDYDKRYQNAFAAGPVTLGADGVERVAIEAYRDPTRRESLLVQNDLTAEVATGPVRHRLLIGADFADQRTRNQRINGFFDSGVATTSNGRRTLVPLADQIVIPPVTFRAGPGNRAVRADARAVGLYVQDQASIGEHVEIIAGLRRDWFDLKVANLLAGTNFSRDDAMWSPRLGLVIKPSATLSFYMSYSRSFLPQSGDQFSVLDLTLAALKPERFTNAEVGAKWRPLPMLDVTLAAYRLDRTNSRETDPATLQTLLTGEQRSTGVELELRGQASKRLSLSGGLAVQDVEIRRSSTAALVGRAAPLAPEFQASAWGRFDFTPRLGAGLGVYHQAASFASISNAVVLPAFTRVDAAGYVALSDGIALQLNVENLLGEEYYATAHNDNNITPGAPRTAAVMRATSAAR